jgi:hypothetical protein
VTPVRRRVEHDVLRPALDPAFQHGLQRFVAGVLGFEGQVIAEHDETVRRSAHERHQVGEAFDVLAMDLDELEQPVACLAPRVRGIHGRMHRFD